MSPPEPPSGPPKEDFESEEKEFKERKIGSDDNIEVPDKQMSKEDNIKLIREWRRTRSIMKDDQNPSFRIPKSKGRYPYFALFRNPNFDINTFEVETWEELKVTTLTPHLMVLGFGEDGIAWVRDEKSSVVFKMYFEMKSFITETRVYLHAKKYPSLSMPKFNGIFYLNEFLFNIALSKIGRYLSSDRLPSVPFKTGQPPSRFCLGISKVKGTTLWNIGPKTDELSDAQYYHIEVTLRTELRKLHDAGIAHLDPVEINIMVSPRFNYVWFIDFGRSMLRSDGRCILRSGTMLEDWAQICEFDFANLEITFEKIRGARAADRERRGREANEASE